MDILKVQVMKNAKNCDTPQWKEQGKRGRSWKRRASEVEKASKIIEIRNWQAS
jgi:hypothetical protein